MRVRRQRRLRLFAMSLLGLVAFLFILPAGLAGAADELRKDVHILPIFTPVSTWGLAAYKPSEDPVAYIASRLNDGKEKVDVTRERLDLRWPTLRSDGSGVVATPDGFVTSGSAVVTIPTAAGSVSNNVKGFTTGSEVFLGGQLNAAGASEVLESGDTSIAGPDLQVGVPFGATEAALTIEQIEGPPPIAVLIEDGRSVVAIDPSLAYVQAKYLQINGSDVGIVPIFGATGIYSISFRLDWTSGGEKHIVRNRVFYLVGEPLERGFAEYLESATYLDQVKEAGIVTDEDGAPGPFEPKPKPEPEPEPEQPVDPVGPVESVDPEPEQPTDPQPAPTPAPVPAPAPAPAPTLATAEAPIVTALPAPPAQPAAAPTPQSESTQDQSAPADDYFDADSDTLDLAVGQRASQGNSTMNDAREWAQSSSKAVLVLGTAVAVVALAGWGMVTLKGMFGA